MGGGRGGPRFGTPAASSLGLSRLVAQLSVLHSYRYIIYICSREILLHMYIYIYVCIHADIYTCTSTHNHTITHTRIHTYMRLYIQMHFGVFLVLDYGWVLYGVSCTLECNYALVARILQWLAKETSATESLV